MKSVHIDSKQAKPDAKLAPHMEGEVPTQHFFHADQGALRGEEHLVLFSSQGAHNVCHLHKAMRTILAKWKNRKVKDESQ